MEPPSGPASRRHVPWNRLLLEVSLLTFWTPPTTAQLTIETVPPLAAEGSDVLLLAHNVTENPLGYAWHRGDRIDNSQLIASYRIDTNVTTKGPTHSGRETLYPNGTLLIQSVTQKDTGSYTLLLTKDDLQTEGQTGHLCIYTVLPTPIITSNNSNPGEHKDTVVLTCRFETWDIFYLCSINNQSLHNSTELELCEGNRTLTMFNVTRNDTGPYVYEAGNPENITHGDPFTLNGLSTPCPWLITGRPPQSIQELFIPNITADKSTSCNCLVHNFITGPSKTTVKAITVSGQEKSPALNREIVIVIMIGILVRASGQNDLIEHQPPATTLGHGPSGSSVSLASLPSPRPAVPIYEELLYPNTDIYCQINPKVDVVS
nr:PREDICTED: carcinoembryonic antigen-related cell adhesion molecule 4 [Bos mutus]